MTNVRTYGRPPYRAAVVHGGPGACGDMAPVARELSARRGVLEPIQTASTLAGQVDELARTLAESGEPPVTVVGHSWGAWLACLVAAERPELASRLVLVGAGPFEERHVARLHERRASRLDPGSRVELDRLRRALESGGEPDGALERIGELCARADDVAPLPWETRAVDELPSDEAECAEVWREAAAMRRSGALLEAVRRVRCPVVAVHGADDPHPVEGVSEPLAAAFGDRFRLVVLARCGHTPWRERHARDAFFAALEAALAEPPRPTIEFGSSDARVA